MLPSHFSPLSPTEDSIENVQQRGPCSHPDPLKKHEADRGGHKLPFRGVYVGLGSNVGPRRRTIAAALERLAAEDGVEVVAVSTLRETDPVGFLDQPRFLNGAALLATSLRPRPLLERLLRIEAELGRIRGRGPRFGPRTIDLDLLLYGDELIDEPGLQVPHPRLHERRFVLEPLAELDPALEIPGRGPVQALLAGL
jgi:2-amino-4-hydroxy-6-hydroxymethyldihydropteridine diphosphokinase